MQSFRVRVVGDRSMKILILTLVSVSGCLATDEVRPSTQSFDPCDPNKPQPNITKCGDRADGGGLGIHYRPEMWNILQDGSFRVGATRQFCFYELK